MYPVVNITCPERGITQKADVLECRSDRLRVAVQGTNLTINLRLQNNVYVGHQAGLEFVCVSSYKEISSQMG